MSANAAVRGIGAVGAFGAGRKALRRALDGGDAGAGPAPRLAADAALAEFVDRKALRRIDHVSRLALLGAHLALRDAGLERPDERTGIVVATGYGPSGTTFAFLDSFIDGGDPASSPTQFSSSVHNAPAAHVSSLLGATGPNLTVSQFELSASSALLTATLWLAERRVDRVLIGGVDEYGPVLGYCWERFFDRADDAECRPLDGGRQSALPGEGCGFLVLESADGAPGAAVIESVHLGRVGAPGPPIPADRLLILGMDGHRRCADAYERIVPPGSAVTSFGHLWGSFPAATALDTAAAALLLESGSAPAPPPGMEGGSAWRVPAAGEPLPAGGVALLRVSAGGEYALTLMSRT